MRAGRRGTGMNDKKTKEVDGRESVSMLPGVTVGVMIAVIAFVLSFDALRLVFVSSGINPLPVSQANNASATLPAKVSGSSDASTSGSAGRVGVPVGPGSPGEVTTGPGRVPLSPPGVSGFGRPASRP